MLAPKSRSGGQGNERLARGITGGHEASLAKTAAHGCVGPVLGRKVLTPTEGRSHSVPWARRTKGEVIALETFWMRRLVKLQLVFVLGLCISFVTNLAAASPPNVLFIYLDDFGWRDTSYMGSDFFETPNLDAWARDGMVFRQAYSCAANCAPARACLMTGQYTPRHQIFNVGTRPRGQSKDRRLKHVPGVDVLDPHVHTWPQSLKAAGYTTAIIGKWHLSDDPLPYGFDVNVAGSHSGSPPRGYYPPHPGAPGLESAPEDEYLTDRLTDEAIRFIRGNQDRPWCLYLSHFAVHSPFQAKQELVQKYREKPPGTLHHHVTMATMIQAVDDGVGRIRELLRELKIEDQTIVVFSSDNGGVGQVTDMAPLRGYKGTYYEGGIRVPMFIVWPHVVTPGSVCDEPVTGVDVFPTLCEMTGAELPVDQLFDGTSLVPRLTGEIDQLRERPLYWHFPAYLQATGPNPEARDTLFRTRPCSVIRKGRWKLIQYFEDNALELYDLDEDQGEQRNLADEKVALAKTLLQELQAWQQDLNAPIPHEPNPDYVPPAIP